MFFLNSKFQSEIDTLETTLFINNEHIIRNVMTLNLKLHHAKRYTFFKNRQIKNMESGERYPTQTTVELEIHTL